MIILDTNVVSEVMRPQPAAAVSAWLRGWALDDLAITAVTLAEIRYGLQRLPEGARRSDLEARFGAFVQRGFERRVLSFDAAAADHYASIVVERQRAGRPIEAFDAMIAAIARAGGHSVATRDAAGFAGCDIPLHDPWAAG